LSILDHFSIIFFGFAQGAICRDIGHPLGGEIANHSLRANPGTGKTEYIFIGPTKAAFSKETGSGSEAACGEK
jgi:hypothetical protein